jgi:hypothetical protein
MNYIGYNFVSILCIIGAIILAYLGKGGEAWGWLLFVALLFGVVPSDRKKKDTPTK